MHITILSPPFNLSGGHRVKAIYADSLTKRGHNVVVVAPAYPKPRLKEKFVSLIRNRDWPKSITNPPSHFDGLDIECRTLDEYRPIRDKDVPNADVVIATWWETAEWVAALSPSKGAKVHFIQHHEVFPYLPVDRVEAVWRMPFHKIVISQWLADLSRDRYGDPNFTMVFNSVNQKQFWALPRSKNRIPTVGFLYSTVPFKGCEVSLRALDLCLKEIPDLRVISFGTEIPSPSLPLPPGAEFILTPDQEALRTIYAECDVWLCGSYSEGFHLPPSEAMACRCPVVSTRVGGPMDIIRDGINGYLVDVGDVVGLADRIMKIVRLPENAWRTMSDAALETVCHYTWDDATDQFEAALYKAVEKHPRN